MAMLIVCPTCTTSYMIDAASLGPAGRTVRCARCRASWHAGGPEKSGSIQGFVNDVIAEAEAQQSAPATDANPPMPARSASESFANKRDIPAPDDFGAETETPFAPPPDGAPNDSAWQASNDASPDDDIGGIDHRGPVAPPEPVHDAPSIVPPAAPSPMRRPAAASTALDVDDVEDFVARRERMKSKRTKRRRASKWTAIVLVLLGFNIALVGARNEVVRYLPQTASLFAMIGLPVNLRNLSFENVKVLKEEADGASVLLIEGEIVSTASSTVEVPRLRFAVRNTRGQEIYAWTALATRGSLAPGERLPFRSRLASPPADSSDVMVRFFTTRDAVAGGK
ncbi:MAG: MJ0042-type zinc finger domain-containing protein [Xanthobacteraceae bacterium]|uniref:MJ0042-type zinc finger domain-containing protein n=1 Tax=Pseudolabrys sp. TaxID=1960880 RepID=UPI003D0E9128